MKPRTNTYLIGWGLALVVLLGCNLAGAISAGPAEATQTATPTEDQTLSPTGITTPTPTTGLSPTNTPAQLTATSGPGCTVLQDLNLRTGPGTAYRPPIRALPAQTRLVPLGYNPVGIPGGPWVQVREETSNQIGWVSAGTQFISCNIDLASLPSVAVAPPPPPPPPGISNSTPEGNFPENFVWEVVFSSQFFVQMRVYDTFSGGTNDGDGIAEVNFTVRDKNNVTVYQRTERQVGYCIFGGGEPDCNPWVIEDFIYKWESGGAPVESGDYQLTILVFATSGDQGNWDYEVKLEFPE